MGKPIILVVNDDGYQAKGLKALTEVVKNYGEVYVVAPDGPRSGMGHAITMELPLRMSLVQEEDDCHIYKINGTPVDCIKMAQKVILRNRHIDLVVSGINHGSNSSVSVIYSGTMAAVIEACFENTKAVGFSLLNYDPNADFTTAQKWVAKIVKKVLREGLPDYTALNVNIPDVKDEAIKGIRITRQAHACWKEDLEPRQDLFGRPYYWLSGYLENHDFAEDTDEWALSHQYVSVQPVQFDMTAHQQIKNLKKWEENA